MKYSAEASAEEASGAGDEALSQMSPIPLGEGNEIDASVHEEKCRRFGNPDTKYDSF